MPQFTFELKEPKVGKQQQGRRRGLRALDRQEEWRRCDGGGYGPLHEENNVYNILVISQDIFSFVTVIGAVVKALQIRTCNVA